jgi:hypothetical protein
MRLSIIRADGAVYKDSVSYAGLDLSAIPANVHALQWYETEGEVEFVSNPDRTKPQNELISELPAWATTAISKWDEARAAEEAAIAAAAEQARIAAENQPVTTGVQTA